MSPLVETTNGLEVLAHPNRAPYARRWVERTKRRLDPAAIAVLMALVNHGSWYVPDFLVPVPATYEPTLEAELAAVAAAPADLVRSQLETTFRIGPPSLDVLERTGTSSEQDPRAPLPVEIADVLATDGESRLPARVVEELRYFWKTAIAESWATVRRVLDEDVRRRAARASQVGFAEIVDDLNP